MRKGLAVVVLMSLGCGGLMSTAVDQAALEQFTEMEAKLNALPDSPGRERVRSVLQRGAVDAAEGDFGFSGLVTLQVAFDEVIADGQVDDNEAAVFEAAYTRILSEQ